MPRRGFSTNRLVSAANVEYPRRERGFSTNCTLESGETGGPAKAEWARVAADWGTPAPRSPNAHA